MPLADCDLLRGFVVVGGGGVHVFVSICARLYAMALKEPRSGAQNTP